MPGSPSLNAGTNSPLCGCLDSISARSVSCSWEQARLAVAAIPLGFLIGYGFCATLTAAMQTELYRMPLVINARTYVISVLIVGLASVATGALLYLRLRRLDLVAVLKTRE